MVHSLFKGIILRTFAGDILLDWSGLMAVLELVREKGKALKVHYQEG